MYIYYSPSHDWFDSIYCLDLEIRGLFNLLRNLKPKQNYITKLGHVGFLKNLGRKRAIN